MLQIYDMWRIVIGLYNKTGKIVFDKILSTQLYDRYMMMRSSVHYNI